MSVNTERLAAFIDRTDLFNLCLISKRLEVVSDEIVQEASLPKSDNTEDLLRLVKKASINRFCLDCVNAAIGVRL